MYRAVTLMTRVQSLNDYVSKDWAELNPLSLVEQTRLVWAGQQPAEIESMNAADRAKLKLEWAQGVWEMIMRDTPQMLRTFGQPTIAILPEGAASSLADAQKAFEKLNALKPEQLVADGPELQSARSLLNEFATSAIQLGRYSHEELYWCDRYASMINFRYWKERTVAESETDTINARRHFFTGFNRFREGDLETARTEFEGGLDLWKTILDKYPRIREDDITAEETVKIVRAYHAVCQQLDIEIALHELPFQDYLRKVMAPQVSSEEYEMMMNLERELQSLPPEEAQKRRQEMMENYKQKQPQPQQPEARPVEP
jgi:hypothetical protein